MEYKYNIKNVELNNNNNNNKNNKNREKMDKVFLLIDLIISKRQPIKKHDRTG